MNILIASDSYKGTQSAVEVANNIGKGIRRVMPSAKITCLPIADGGEGTVQAIMHANEGQIISEEVIGPLGDKIQAKYAVLKTGVAVIEMSAASGLPLVEKSLRDALKATSYGTGQLIKSALDYGCKEIIIGVGGSATNDAGVGMAQALGVSFLDEDGKELDFGGVSLDRLHTIDIRNLDKRLEHSTIRIASDVTNPLFGEIGASAVFGPQKGATPEQVRLLDDNLRHFAKIIKEQLGVEVDDLAGAGAGGGISSSLVVFCKAEIQSGINVILDTIRFDDYVKDADLVITGEGKIDGQSIFGKVPVGVAQRVKSQSNIPVIAVVGDMGQGAEKVYEYGIDGIMSTVNRAMPLSDALSESAELLQDAGKRLMEFILIGSKVSSVIDKDIV